MNKSQSAVKYLKDGKYRTLVLLLVLIGVCLFLASCKTGFPDRPQDVVAKYIFFNKEKQEWDCEAFKIPKEASQDWIRLGPCNPSDINESFVFSADHMLEIRQWSSDVNSWIDKQCK